MPNRPGLGNTQFNHPALVPSKRLSEKQQLDYDLFSGRGDKAATTREKKIS